MPDSSTTHEKAAGTHGQAPQPDSAGKPQAKGFRLPDPNAPPTPTPAGGTSPLPAAVATPAPTTALQQPPPPGLSGPVKADTALRDQAIGGGLLLVLAVAFFFAKNGYANLLVARRVAPRSANASGWWLFVFLISLASGAVLAALDQERFLTPVYVAGFAGAAVLALILMLITGRR